MSEERQPNAEPTSIQASPVVKTLNPYSPALQRPEYNAWEQGAASIQAAGPQEIERLKRELKSENLVAANEIKLREAAEQQLAEARAEVQIAPREDAGGDHHPSDCIQFPSRCGYCNDKVQRRADYWHAHYDAAMGMMNQARAQKEVPTDGATLSISPGSASRATSVEASADVAQKEKM